MSFSGATCRKHWTYWKYKAPVSEAAFLLWQEDIANTHHLLWSYWGWKKNKASTISISWFYDALWENGSKRLFRVIRRTEPIKLIREGSLILCLFITAPVIALSLLASVLIILWPTSSARQILSLVAKLAKQLCQRGLCVTQESKQKDQWLSGGHQHGFCAVQTDSLFVHPSRTEFGMTRLFVYMPPSCLSPNSQTGLKVTGETPMELPSICNYKHLQFLQGCLMMLGSAQQMALQFQLENTGLLF